MTQRALSPWMAVLACGAWMAAFGNIPLWRKLGSLGLFASASGIALTAGLFLMIAGVLAALLGLFAWRWSLKVTASLMLLVTAAASHFMLGYGIVVDPGMVVNALQTDAHEAGALASWSFAGIVAALAVAPGWLLWRQPLDHGGAVRQLGRNTLLVFAGMAVAAAAAIANFQALAPLMRNNKDLRYLINPLASVYSIGRVASYPFARNDSVLVRAGEDAVLARPAGSATRPQVLLLVLGETARSGNFALNGYGRPTTPELRREGAVSFRNAWSCGTSTAASVPCMFSPLGKDAFEGRKNEHEGLLDVLQRAGLAVLWIDNQSGCKGVCDRVPSVSTANAKSPTLCADGECLDEVMLEGLDQRIAVLDPARVARGVVIVMHQMGSHGPAYHLRSPQALKRFQLECKSADLQDCSRDTLLNAYDNSIVYTDHFLGKAIGWLKGKASGADTAMIYVSDHGESLGENNLYLHGMPYSLAPDVQKHVPWITWLSDDLQRSAGLSASCLAASADKRITHDSYFHAVLGFMHVATKDYREALDTYAACRGQVGDVALAPVARQPRIQ